MPVSQMLNVHVRVNDAATGKPTPVRVRFAGPGGEYYPPLARPAEFPIGRNEDVGGHVYLANLRRKEHLLSLGDAAAVKLARQP